MAFDIPKENQPDNQTRSHDFLVHDIQRKTRSRVIGENIFRRGNCFVVSFELVSDEEIGGTNGSIRTIRNWLTNWAAGLSFQGKRVRVRRLDVIEKERVNG